MPMTELHSTTPELDPRLTSLAEGFAALTEDIDALVAQRDELLAALKALVDARRSMEAFALMREQLKREREVKADLLAAAKLAIENPGCSDGDCCTAARAQTMALNSLRAAIAKATGGAL